MPSPKFDDGLFAFQGTATERRDAFERERRRLVAERQELIDSQASPAYAANQRIRLWESLHQLRLPASPEHALLRVIARQTGLTLAEVHQEQSARSIAQKS